MSSWHSINKSLGSSQDENTTPLLHSALLAFDRILGGAPAFSKDHALLVGVSEYPNLEKESWLRGPVNDVILVSVLFESRFGFKKRRYPKIVRLAERRILSSNKSKHTRRFQ
ncbi:caspase family protein [Verrucomicrobiales bacterium]|nr:caspase family protein [Verrucomicrobiales bacterium]